MPRNGGISHVSVCGNWRPKRDFGSVFLLKRLVRYRPPPPRAGGGGWQSESLLASSIQGRKVAGQQMRCRWRKCRNPFSRPIGYSRSAMGGNPYGQSRDKTGDGWQLRDRAPWAIFHIHIDKHPNEPLRLRHVHRGCSCGRTIVDVR